MADLMMNTPPNFLRFLTLVLFLTMLGSCHNECVMPVEPENPEPPNPPRILNIVQDSTTDGDSYLHKTISAASFKKSLYNIVANWTRFGEPTQYRSLMKFDLSEVKINEEIISAKLYLTPRTTGNPDEITPDIIRTVNNNFRICLVKSAWNISNVSWDTQPVYSAAAGESIVFIGVNEAENVLEYDITNLVKQISGVDKKYDNNGFLLKMDSEVVAPPYEAMTFCSMNSTELSKRPKLSLVLLEK